MGTQRESKLSREIQKALRLEGYFCFKVHGNEYMMAGLNDIIVCVEGFFVALETKNPGEHGDTSAIQELRHHQIKAAGGVSEVVTSVAQALKVCREVAQRSRGA